MTIYDIAEEAGVSASSVSRVVNNKPGVNAKTRLKIQKLLDKYHFAPNEAARGLVKQASHMIGILAPDIRVSYHTETVHCIERELAILGYCCLLFNTGQDEADQCHYIQTLEQRRVEGAVLVGSSFQTPAVQEAVRRHLADIPVVMVNGYFDLPNVYGILWDEKHGVRRCVALLADKAHRKSAYIYDTSASAEMREGYLRAIDTLGRADKPWVYETEPTLLGGYTFTNRLLAEHPDVDGIVYSSDLLAAGGLRALAEHGVRVPQQVAVVGVGNGIYSEICTPKLTSLDNKVSDAGIAAARVMGDCLDERKTVKKLMLFSSIIEREST